MSFETIAKCRKYGEKSTSVTNGANQLRSEEVTIRVSLDDGPEYILASHVRQTIVNLRFPPAEEKVLLEELGL